MIVEKDLRRLFNQLIHNDFAQIDLEGFNITIRIFDQASKLSLSTPVYNGGNFIPTSVRKCLSHKAPYSQTMIKTYLSVDEKNFQIHLHYLGLVDHMNNDIFKNLLEEFNWVAHEWKNHLDEHDKNDLVHVRVK
jgi:hypothetical protein